jgi:hypothetical protein
LLPTSRGLLGHHALLCTDRPCCSVIRRAWERRGVTQRLAASPKPSRRSRRPGPPAGTVE